MFFFKLHVRMWNFTCVHVEFHVHTWNWKLHVVTWSFTCKRGVSCETPRYHVEFHMKLGVSHETPRGNVEFHMKLGVSPHPRGNVEFHVRMKLCSHVGLHVGTCLRARVVTRACRHGWRANVMFHVRMWSLKRARWPLRATVLSYGPPY